MFLYIKTNILRGYGIFKNDFAHPREPATATLLHHCTATLHYTLVITLLTTHTVISDWQQWASLQVLSSSPSQDRF